jgi:hypothetical protein
VSCAAKLTSQCLATVSGHVGKFITVQEFKVPCPFSDQPALFSFLVELEIGIYLTRESITSKPNRIYW